MSHPPLGEMVDLFIKYLRVRLPPPQAVALAIDRNNRHMMKQPIQDPHRYLRSPCFVFCYFWILFSVGVQGAVAPCLW